MRRTRRNLMRAAAGTGALASIASVTGANTGSDEVSEDNVVYENYSYKVYETEVTGNYIYTKEYHYDETISEHVVSASRIQGRKFANEFRDASSDTVAYFGQNGEEITCADRQVSTSDNAPNEDSWSVETVELNSVDQDGEVSIQSRSPPDLIEDYETEGGSTGNNCGVLWKNCDHKYAIFGAELTIEGVAVSSSSASIIVDFAIFAISQLAAIQVSAGFYACVGALAALIVALQGSEFTFAWLDNDEGWGQVQTIDYNYKGRTSMVDPDDIGGMTYVGELPGDHLALGC